MNRIKCFLLSVISLLCALLVATHAHAEVRVVATTPDLAAIAQAVGGNRVRVTALAASTQDPHFVDARPHLALELSKADLLILVGAELEVGWLPSLLAGARNPKIESGTPGYLEAATLVDLLDVPVGKVDRSQGDIHPSGSPHFLLDPRRAERVAVGIGKRLAALDEAGRDSYLENTKHFVTDLRAAREVYEKKLARLRGKTIVDYHRSLTYLAEWLGLEVVEHLEPKPGIPPNPKHIADVIQVGRARNVSGLVQEEWYSSSTSKVVADSMGVPLVVIPGMTKFQSGQTYIQFIGALAAKLNALK